MADSDLDSGCKVVRITRQDLERRQAEEKAKRRAEAEAYFQRAREGGQKGREDIQKGLAQMGQSALGILAILALMKFLGVSFPF